ncbi:MAG TPA: DnaJ domain-containing protein [Luteibacter sp.]|uniref:J domain-containing protein n=1 Tax=Luteibacter sp. TaxID=1886636 RepID=UPI002C6630D2|nr:DnaJ domain-containing protein [Luteibacter sp.]HVI53898.1 DnaJ domain-containing protein [Luteibacter sp.]
MTLADIIVIAICLALGYKFASSMMSKSASPADEGNRPEPPNLFLRQPPWHEVLGVSADATHDQIVGAYRARMSEYHPDKVANLGPDIRALAEQKAKEINAAYAEAMAEYSGSRGA